MILLIILIKKTLLITDVKKGALSSFTILLKNTLTN